MSDDDLIDARLGLAPVVTPSDWPIPDPAEPDYAGTFAETLGDVLLVALTFAAALAAVVLFSILSGY